MWNNSEYNSNDQLFNLIFEEMNRKKMYEKPSVEVVKLQTTVAMLEASATTTSADKNDYGTRQDQEWWE